MSQYDKSAGSEYVLLISESHLQKVPQSVRDDGNDSVDEHLMKALEIGLIAMDSATAGLNMADLEDKMNSILDDFAKGLTASTDEVNQLIEDKLVGEDSALKTDLNAVLGDNGSISNLFNDMARGLTDPQLKNSVPNTILDTFGKALGSELDKIKSVLDPTKDGPFGQGIRTIQKAQKDAETQLEGILTKMAQEQTIRFGEILHGLELAGKDEELIAQEKEALRRSSHKGEYFENDMLEALQQIRASSKWSDEITHTGAKVVEGSLVKAGDIHIKIIDPSLTTATASIAVEAKSGHSMSLPKISAEAKRGREARSAEAGIGVMVREARGTTQPMLSPANAGKDTIAVVDWAPGELNDDPAQWVALEASYATTRARLIADAAAATGGVDADAVRKQAAQVQKDLEDFKNLKTKTTQAKKSVEAIEDYVEEMETKLKTSITTLKDLTKS